MTSNPPPDPEESSEIADAAGLFADASAPRSGGPAGRSTPQPEAADGYEVIGGPEPADDRPVPPPIPMGRSASPRPPRPPEPSARASRRDPAEAVDQVWTRAAEWGPNLAAVGGAFFFLMLVLYGLLGAEQYLLAFLFLLFGGFVLLLLCYPMFITLERPVRVTPEQAARDFYQALSHHRPHFRRMWLLLSREGRVCTDYGSLEGFARYWAARLAEIRKAKGIPATTPLKFEVEDFKSAKSAGMDELPASFTVKVLVRGRHAEGPVEAIRVQTTLVKGPDRMWYLDRGTLP